MPAPKNEMAAKILEESLRNKDVVGWGLYIDKRGPGRNWTVTVSNEAGLSSSHVINPLGLSIDDIVDAWLTETIIDVRKKRKVRQNPKGEKR